jgi:biopolymer transport protein ExbD
MDRSGSRQAEFMRAVERISTYPIFRLPFFFISYRRSDIPTSAALVYDALVRHCSRRHVFLDIDTLVAGDDFPHLIRSTIAKCDCLLAIVGPNWASGSPPRILAEGDFVRLEIAEALKQRKPIVALYFDAQKITPEALPADIWRFARAKWINATGDNLDGILRRVSRLIRPRLSWRMPMAAFLISATVLGTSAPAFLAFSDPRRQRPDALAFSVPGSPSGQQTFDYAKGVFISITDQGYVSVQDQLLFHKPSASELDTLSAIVKKQISLCVEADCPREPFIRGDRFADAEVVFRVIGRLREAGLTPVIVVREAGSNQ